jgi:multiple sugar transport system permease protein
LTGGGPVTSTQTLPLLVYKQAFGMNAMGQASTYAIGIMVVLMVFMILYLYRTQRGRKAST